MLRQPILRSKNLTIEPNSHWKIESAERRYLLIKVEDNSEGFDLAFTEKNGVPEDDDWIDKVGSDGIFVIDTGCSSEIHFRDTDNQGAEQIAIVSDVPAVFTQIS